MLARFNIAPMTHYRLLADVSRARFNIYNTQAIDHCVLLPFELIVWPNSCRISSIMMVFSVFSAEKGLSFAPRSVACFLAVAYHRLLRWRETRKITTAQMNSIPANTMAIIVGTLKNCSVKENAVIWLLWFSIASLLGNVNFTLNLPFIFFCLWGGGQQIVYTGFGRASTDDKSN